MSTFSSHIKIPQNGAEGITYTYALMNLMNTLTSHATSLAKPIKEPSQGRGGLKNLVV